MNCYELRVMRKIYFIIRKMNCSTYVIANVLLGVFVRPKTIIKTTRN